MTRWTFVWLLTMTLLGGAALAQEPPTAGTDDEELRQAIETHFRNRLRAELSLSDEQLEAIWPHVQQLETSRREIRRERRSVLRELRQTYRGGGTDEQLQELLDRLDGIRQREQAAEQAAMEQIDRQLSARQRVEFRFFVTRFRQALRERVETLRRERRR